MNLTEVAELSLDQIYMLLTDRDVLKSKGVRSKSLSSAAACALIADKDGMAKGRDKDGNPIVGRIGGKSLATIIREKAEERERLKELKNKEHKHKSEPASFSGKMSRKQRRKLRGT